MLARHLKFLTTLIIILCIFSCKETTKDEEQKNTASKNKAPLEIAALNEQIKNDPNNPDLYHQRAKYYSNNKDIDAALADMGRALKLDSAKTDYYLTLSDLYFKINKTRNSKEALEKCVSIDPKNTEALLKLAELYLYVKQNQESINYINQVLKADPYNAKAYFMKGMNYKEIGDTNNAISSMATAVEQDQQYYAAYIQLGILHAALKNTLALDYYNNALRIKPNSIEALYNTGKFYQDMEDYKNALEAYSKLLKIAPAYKYAHFNKGVIYLTGLSNYKMALDCFNDAIKSDSQYAEAYYGRGTCYQEMGDLKNAKESYRMALQMNANYSPAIDAINAMEAKGN